MRIEASSSNIVNPIPCTSKPSLDSKIRILRPKSIRFRRFSSREKKHAVKIGHFGDSVAELYEVIRKSNDGDL